MDGIMDMSSHYDLEERGNIMVPFAIRSSSQPFSMNDIKTCAICRSSLRSIGRYGRLVRRAILDESTKRLVLWSNQRYVEISSGFQNCFEVIKAIEVREPPKAVPQAEMISAKREDHIHNLGAVLRAYDKEGWRKVKQFRTEILNYRHLAQQSEQPFSKVRDAVFAVRRRTRKTINFEFDENVLQTKGFALASSLLLRLDLAVLTSYLSLKQPVTTSISGDPIEWAPWMADLQAFRTLAEEAQRVVQQVESCIYFAQMYAIQRSRLSDITGSEQLRQAGMDEIHRGRDICARNSGQTRGMTSELDALETMLRASTFYTAVSSDERQSVIRAMATEFLGTGHWYYCENGHPFTIGECGMPMERATCPECSAPVGGQSHQSVAGNRHADDLEAEVGALRL